MLDHGLVLLALNGSANATEAPGSESSGGGGEGLSSSAAIGIIMSICGNVLISLGLNVQKHSHNTNEAVSGGPKKNYLLRRTWWIGFAMMIVGELGNFIAYAFAPASVVAPLGTVALISNAIVAPLVLKERFRLQDLIGIVISIGGAILIVIFAPDEVPLTKDDIIKALGSTKFLVFLAFSIVAIGVLWYLSSKYSQRYLIVNMALVGILGGYTVVSIKAVGELIFKDFWGSFTEWVFYVVLTMFIVTAVLQVRFLQAALQNFDSTEVIPAQFVCFTIGAIVTSGVMYDEFSGMSALEVSIFILGCLLTFFGVYVITKGRARKRAGSIAGSTRAKNTDTLLGGSNDAEDSPLIVSTTQQPQDESLVARFQHMTENTVDAIVAGIRAQTIIHAKAVDLTYDTLQEDDDDVEMGFHENIPLSEAPDRSRVNTMLNGTRSTPPGSYTQPQMSQSGSLSSLPSAGGAGVGGGSGSYEGTNNVPSPLSAVTSFAAAPATPSSAPPSALLGGVTFDSLNDGQFEDLDDKTRLV